MRTRLPRWSPVGLLLASTVLSSCGGNPVGTPVQGVTPVVAVAPVAALPLGTKPVGAKGVAIAIPRSWGFLQDVGCGSPSKPYYLIDEHTVVAYSCPAVISGTPRPAPVSHLEIDEDLADPGPAAPPHAARCGRGTCTRTWRVAGVQLELTVAARPDVARARLARLGDTIRRLPRGEAVVPPWVLVPTTPGDDSYGARATPGRYEVAVRRAGLRVDRDRVDPYDRVTAPAQGTVVQTGSTVTVGSR